MTISEGYLISIHFSPSDMIRNLIFLCRLKADRRRSVPPGFALGHGGVVVSLLTFLRDHKSSLNFFFFF
jgi:hypothetical protein